MCPVSCETKLASKNGEEQLKRNNIREQGDRAKYCIWRKESFHFSRIAHWGVSFKVIQFLTVSVLVSKLSRNCSVSSLFLFLFFSDGIV